MTFKLILMIWLEKTFPNPQAGDTTTISNQISRRRILEKSDPLAPAKIFMIEEVSLAFQRRQSPSVPVDEQAAEKWRDELQGLLEDSDRFIKFQVGNEIVSQMTEGGEGAIQKIRSILLVAKFYIKREISAEE